MASSTFRSRKRLELRPKVLLSDGRNRSVPRLALQLSRESLRSEESADGSGPMGNCKHAAEIPTAVSRERTGNQSRARDVRC